MNSHARLFTVGMLCWLVLSEGCDRKQAAAHSTSSSKQTLILDGSASLEPLLWKWARAFEGVQPGVTIQVVDVTSNVAFARLVAGRCDMAAARHRMSEKEIERFRQSFQGQEPSESVVGYDAIAVFVHPTNPREMISIPELEAIFGENGNVTQWSQLAVTIPDCPGQEISRVSWQHGSGNLEQFRKAVLKPDEGFRQGAIEEAQGPDLVSYIAKRPCAIGYGDMQYKRPDVKWLKVSKNQGEEGRAPDAASVRSGEYVMSNPLLIYSAGPPAGNVKRFIEWCDSADGQAILSSQGFVPLKD